MKSSQLRKKFLTFFERHGHKIVPSSSLLPTDPSVLFTTAGMQQFKPYYLGEKSPWGPNVASCQKCIRTSDIEEVGDERHLTFFEMLGNFSFGGPALKGVEGYFKERAIQLAHEFIVKELKLEIDYVAVFSPDKVADGDWRKGVAEDRESYEIWKKYLPENKINKEGIDNFWGPTGDEGPCGPTTEIYVNGIEIWNIVFNEFFCDKNKKLEKLPTPGVDTGMGLERLAMVIQKVLTVFETDLFSSLLIEDLKNADKRTGRIILDHIKASVFLISDGVIPSNKDQGYVLRRLLRRAMTYAKISKFSKEGPVELINKIIDLYKDQYSELESNRKKIVDVIYDERKKFGETIEKGLKELGKMEKIDAVSSFYLYQTFGLPFDIIKELKAKDLNQKEFEDELKKHQELSRTASSGMFKGGLADNKPETIKLHTAHHLLLAALQELFGKQVKQKGSNINSERLRIDFSFDRKLTDEEKKRVEDMVNEKVKEGLDVIKREMPLEKARKIGAQMEFGVKYGSIVSVYFIEDKEGNVFSKEFCGGPHVKNTSELGRFKIIKEEAVSSGVRRIKAKLE
ncbi:MAG: alanine--tRNA ligase-related protein [Patescibacteria group bacterium]